MANYNFHSNMEQSLRERYKSVDEAAEIDESLQASLAFWRETFMNVDSLPQENALQKLFLNLKNIAPMAPRRLCPRYRVFVSHRQCDKDYALRIANIANDQGFEFWLDILDPHLSSLPKGISPQTLALLTACIIEMGLVNSTHVLAVMTPNTRGSEWLPYEYGRIRQASGLVNTGCWQYQPLGHTLTLPDYMLLGEINDSEADIENWLDSFGSTCPPIPWTGPVPKLLP